MAHLDTPEAVDAPAPVSVEEKAAALEDFLYGDDESEGELGADQEDDVEIEADELAEDDDIEIEEDEEVLPLIATKS